MMHLMQPDHVNAYLRDPASAIRVQRLGVLSGVFALQELLRYMMLTQARPCSRYQIMHLPE